MSDLFKLDAEMRTVVGRGASRRLRREQDKLPAIIYGGGKKPTMITLLHNKVLHALENEAFYSHILTLNIGKKVEKVVLKDLQRHPYKKQILHADFLRVKSDEVINMTVPLHFIGEEMMPGVKMGGTIKHHMTEVDIQCLPANLPEFISVDVSKLEINDSVHLSDLVVPNGVMLGYNIEDPNGNLIVISVHAPRGGADSDKDDSSESEKEVKEGSDTDGD